MWIKRDLSQVLAQNQDPIQILKGPRQCGKSSLLLSLDPVFQEASLDDSALRELAQSDPELFLKQFSGKKLFIDEAQYAPALFPALKRVVDLERRGEGPVKTMFRLTGSNQILMDRQVKESLAGRASYFELNTLSVAEICDATPSSIQDILYAGGWPELHARAGREVKKYLDDYVSSYVEKDIVLAAGIQKSREFLKFLRLLAGRVGALLDLSHFANEVGVDVKTIKDWVSVVETMGIVALVQPFSTNLSSRLVKSPKVYFLDTGLAARLQGWSSSTPIMTSPQQGGLFENLVFGELYRLNTNFGLGWTISHWRSRDGEEIDFLVQASPTKFCFVESKTSALRPTSLGDYPEVKKVFQHRKPDNFVCHQEGERVLAGMVPIRLLRDHLLAWGKHDD